MLTVFLPLLWAYGILLTGVWITRAGRAVKSLREFPKLIPTAETGYDPSLPLVSVIVPVRNEASNIPELLASLLNQNYPSYEIIVVNNGSTDETGKLLKKYVSSFPQRSSSSFPHGVRRESDPRLKSCGDDGGDVWGNDEGPDVQVLEANHTPEGWTGKNYALSVGSGAAKGDWLLFVDADTRHEPASIRTAVTTAQQNEISFLTALPKCLAKGFWEHLIQPTSMSFIGLWFPIEKINDPRSPLAFANGQYLLIRRELYQKIGGHREVRQEYLEDFALMGKTKEAGAKAVCALGVEIYGTRMYESIPAIWRGWRRIFLHAFQSKPEALVLKSFDLLFFTTLPYILFPALLVLGVSEPNIYSGLICLFLGILGIVTATAWKAFAIVRARKRYAPLIPLGSLILAAILGHAAWIAFRKKPTQWR